MVFILIIQHSTWYWYVLVVHYIIILLVRADFFLKDHSEFNEATSFKHAAAASSCAATTWGLNTRSLGPEWLASLRNPIPYQTTPRNMQTPL